MREFCDMLPTGLMIGLLFGVPVGAVGALVVQRTLSRGFLAGLLTGSGSSVADCLYAGVGAFGLTFVSDCLLRWRTPISVVGGLLMAAMGVASLMRRREGEAGSSAGRMRGDSTRTRDMGMFASALAVGVTNPAAILGFLFAFSCFGIAGPLDLAQGVSLVAGILAGTMLWWLALAGLAAVLRERCTPATVARMERCFAVLVALIGIGIVIAACIGLFDP
ncbi:lysine transporter LysE [Bifidobacterium lemurum]|uniref:Lysine transporter LysE n=1 Tax=Bifidobacterium lemurum TaxID=1603886 RepID=A0A261FVZ3_9BIFI|nr:LysE family transporter [Bifidobacterium lemurum]OZG63364.1 lysine transporter LysE [Bifidobacterium lemurum]QOL34273.1 LysE family transporter [Bifidobacterium lemurum]